MPKIELAFRPGATTEVFVPDRNLLFCAVHQKAGNIPDQQTVIQQALDNPIGSLGLEELLRDKQKGNRYPQVTVLIDDITRPTPTDRILPQVLNRIGRAGIPEQAVRIFVAMGTHRVMTEQELVTKVGNAVLEHYPIVNRDYLSAEFVHLGKTASGTPIEVDRTVVEADVKVAIGNVVPHVSAGWGGGSKIILPGACSRRTTDMMHLMACIVQPVLEVLGRRDNKPRAEMDAIAERLGLDFVLNTVMDEDKNILGAFAGHFIAAHRRACELAEQVMVVPVPRPADIVIVSAMPCHVDYWQGIKPYVYAHRAVREGGVIIFLLDGAEGLCGDAPSHEETVRKYLSWSFADQKAAVERGEVEDLVGLNVPMYHATVHDRVRATLCVTRHLVAADIKALGFDPAPDVQSALTQAFQMLGDEAKVGVIPFGGETLVRVEP
jgi:nickel-dependent lactate racemase